MSRIQIKDSTAYVLTSTCSFAVLHVPFLHVVGDELVPKCCERDFGTYRINVNEISVLIAST